MASMWTILPFRSIILIPILNLSAMRTRNIRFLLALTGMEEDFQSDREREYFTIPPKKSFFDEKNAFILINCFRSFSFCAWKMCSCFLDFSFSLLLFRFFSGFGLWSLLLRCFMLIFFYPLLFCVCWSNSANKLSCSTSFMSRNHFFHHTNPCSSGAERNERILWGKWKIVVARKWKIIKSNWILNLCFWYASNGQKKLLDLRSDDLRLSWMVAAASTHRQTLSHFFAVCEIELEGKYSN